MRISIEKALCKNYGMCVKLAPEIFRFQEHNRMAMVYRTPVPGSYIELCREAAWRCPNGAITIDEEYPIYAKPARLQATVGTFI